MPHLNRRRFFQIAGATASAAALTAAIERAAAIPAARRAGSIEDVEHIVVLMQENRSFDHYFGRLKGVRGFGDPRPVTLPSGKSVFHQADNDGKETLPFHPTVDDMGMQFLQGLDHNWPGGHQAINDGRYDNWVPAKTPVTMTYLERDDMPFHYALADKFTVCDAYHCSFIGATQPNRYYLWTGHTGNDGKGGGPELGNADKGFTWTTYPERLEKAGVSWKVYQDIGDGLDKAGGWGWLEYDEGRYRGNYGDNALLWFQSYRDAEPGDPLYDKTRTGTDVKGGDGYFDQLRDDVQNGRLPQISWIAAPEAFSEHPNWPTNYGAWYLARVLDALTSDPEVWSRTALFITYDENDGFFDHVVPPYPPSSPAQGKSTEDTTGELYEGDADYEAGNYGLGPRVPMLVVSPWSTGGYVCSEVFDHTSVLRFMERRFGVQEPNISPWRRAMCGDLTSAFDFSAEDPEVDGLPDTAAYEPKDRQSHPDYTPEPPASGSLPAQERGGRRARPLPYAPYVDAAADHGKSRLTLTFHGGPDAGAHFYVTSANRDDAPWTYTVGAGKVLRDTWHIGAAADQHTHDLTVHGPNGFLRHYRGPAGTALPEVTARHNADAGDLQLTARNPGDAEAVLTVRNAYGDSSGRLTVPAGGTRQHTVRTGGSGHWYDVSVTCAADDTYLRRFAGHVETGKPSVSDPKIRTN
ncbi:phosphocholine-specific phospholipase C [Streptomyces coffeae]|uniref:phospholipase C n=1 Tax=Streptomyces coffeae TaxID=621382 RepID=A0ABS1NKE7_9ACTN|nr:phospholipase C, phosphocholine-specific [Streptomyces coffeae]MBL1100579.1 phospholipase C, phosphocholine-specific [Streptomyces coffeae]